MDKEQAIETLRANYPDACYEQLREAVDMAIEALKAQLFHDGTTSDLISRQQTLNALMDAVKSVGVLDADDIKTVFDALPSVQHEKAQLSQEGTTSDLISRQAAIKALHEQANQMTNWAEIYKQQRKGILTATNIIKDLPSAQPEPSIPLSWVEKHIEWLKGIDNEFAKLAAAHISVMVKKWRDEQDETD